MTYMSSFAADELRVRNTFIDVGPSPTMDRFQRERAALSCPGSCVGQLEDTFGRSAYTWTAADVKKPAIISLMDALADLPTMPSTPEPLRSWQPILHDIPVRFAADVAAGTHGSHAAAATDPLVPAAAEQMLPPFPLPDMAAEQMMPPSWGPGRTLLPVAPSQPAPGSDELPSLGSAGHQLGECKPCAFLHSKGCSSGAMCKFCHLCDAGEKKRRQKERKQAFRQAEP